jgi:protein involved in polysaccharide export with SLBB domain
MVRFAGVLAAVVGCAGLGGCAAMTNPVADGIPAERVPPQYLGRPREEEKTISLTLLRQKPPDAYRLDAGDILGVYIDNILGDRNQPPPVRVSEQGTNLQPAFGYPIPISENGSLPLPLIPPVPLKGLTLPEAQQAIVNAYETVRTGRWYQRPKAIIDPGNARVIVTLYKQRQVHVQVVRQDSGGLTIGAQGVIGSTKRGTGATVDLPAYENDVLNALNRTGGLPGLDAVNEVVIQRGTGQADSAGQVVRIPLRMRAGEPPPFRPEDVVLQTGDIVFIEARDTELFYTGGLLPPHQFVLPRDYDLRVVDAIALAQGPLVNGAFNLNNLTGATQATGLGSPSPSLVSVVRRTRDYGQLVIRVDLNRALRDSRENILIQAGDVLVLQETPTEATTRYITTVLHFNFLANLFHGANNATLNLF